jgi:hypothetical protein
MPGARAAILDSKMQVMSEESQKTKVPTMTWEIPLDLTLHKLFHLSSDYSLIDDSAAGTLTSLLFQTRQPHTDHRAFVVAKYSFFTAATWLTPSFSPGLYSNTVMFCTTFWSTDHIYNGGPLRRNRAETFLSYGHITAQHITRVW